MRSHAGDLLELAEKLRQGGCEGGGFGRRAGDRLNPHEEGVRLGRKAGAAFRQALEQSGS